PDNNLQDSPLKQVELDLVNASLSPVKEGRRKKKHGRGTSEDGPASKKSKNGVPLFY
ncbi:hypothetical protein A2U01_0082269, partial [Trifolium medium]|nr:hypothetical protein [Trifolium medium]